MRGASGGAEGETVKRASAESPGRGSTTRGASATDTAGPASRMVAVPVSLARRTPATGWGAGVGGVVAATGTGTGTVGGGSGGGLGVLVGVAVSFTENVSVGSGAVSPTTAT